jgi:hypothetical protein
LFFHIASTAAAIFLTTVMRASVGFMPAAIIRL